MTSYPHILTVCGTGRNVGKTTLACQLIQAFSNRLSITGIKLSTHFHQPGQQLWRVDEEQDPPQGKDTWRMKEAGATRILYVQSLPEFLPEAIREILGRLNPKEIVVCESNSLARYIRPGLTLLISRSGESEIKESTAGLFTQADIIIESNGLAFFFPDRFPEHTPLGWQVTSIRNSHIFPSTGGPTRL